MSGQLPRVNRNSEWAPQAPLPDEGHAAAPWPRICAIVGAKTCAPRRAPSLLIPARPSILAVLVRHLSLTASFLAALFCFALPAAHGVETKINEKGLKLHGAWDPHDGSPLHEQTSRGRATARSS